MKAGKSLEWQRLYQNVLSESDPEKLPEQLRAPRQRFRQEKNNLPNSLNTKPKGGPSPTHRRRCAS